MKICTPTRNLKIHWLSDLHLDKATEAQSHKLHGKLEGSDADCVVITGDTSTSNQITNHLRVISEAASPQPVYFVTGNHDYFGGKISTVDEGLQGLCRQVKNLHYLEGKCIIPLSRTTCLIGHRGWPDARAGYGQRTLLKSPDHRAIRDFHGLTSKQALAKMREMGNESASAIRRILPLALARFQHVIIMTHIPPFHEAVVYAGKPCSPAHLPHYVNHSLGLVIRGIARAYPEKKITVLAGHTHCAKVTKMAHNVSVRVAGARTGRPSPQMLDFI
jgi:predicted MPP superfamily phosphohydrolase